MGGVDVGAEQRPSALLTGDPSFALELARSTAG
jgi:hypothetical protein